MAMAPRSFVLVHGAWTGGWIWRPVADRLVARGHRVFAPTLTGLGERSHLLSRDITLATHVQDVVNLIRWEELHGIVLVGHSYAGMVITGVTESVADGIIDSVVYLDAALPEDGKSLADYAPLPPSVDGLIIPLSAAPPRINAADAPRLNRLRTPQPARTFTESLAVRGALGRIRRKSYVLCTGYDYGWLGQFAATARQDMNWNYHELGCGHDPMLAMPDRTADILELAAGDG